MKEKNLVCRVEEYFCRVMTLDRKYLYHRDASFYHV